MSEAYWVEMWYNFYFVINKHEVYLNYWIESRLPKIPWEMRLYSRDKKWLMPLSGPFYMKNFIPKKTHFYNLTLFRRIKSLYLFKYLFRDTFLYLSEFCACIWNHTIIPINFENLLDQKNFISSISFKLFITICI